MLSKYEHATKFLKDDTLLSCPICNEILKEYDHSLICNNNHLFNISKKGTTVLLNTSNYKDSKIYNHNLFYNRRKFIEQLFYNKMYNKIETIINEYFSKNRIINVLDLGCGEGSHTLTILKNINKKYKYYGFDYSKNAIDMASDYNDANRFYFVADVNNIPAKDNSIDLIIDILSPYNEKEIKRVLKKNGLFIKVSPNKNYLKELRESLNIETYEKEKEIENNFRKHFKSADKTIIRDTLPIDKNDFEYLLNMTPIHNKKVVEAPKNITIDLVLYIVKGEKI